MIEQDISQAYATALAAFVGSADDDALELANDIGRQALGAGMSIGDVVEMHRQTVDALLARHGATTALFARSISFFQEIAAIFDMALKGYRDSVSQMRLEVEERRRTENELRDATLELSRQREMLEQRVAERTRELSQQAADLETANSRLKRANDDLDEFVYAAAHDLKEPLRGIGNHASILAEDFGPELGEDGKRRLDRMRALCRRMDRLLADVAFFARVGHAGPELETVAAADTVAETVAALQPLIRSRGAEVRVLTPLPCVQGDRPLIAALFRQLIDNGLRFNASERPLVTVSATDGRGRGALAEFAIKDNGIGIDPRFRDEIFRIFKRLNTDGAYGDGAGAGLTHAKKIVETHGGRIWIESAPGRGSTFRFNLRKGPE